MSNFLEKGVFLGIGALALTKEKAEQLAKELIEKGMVTNEDSPNLVKEIMSYAEKEKKAFEEKLDSAVEKAFHRIGRDCTLIYPVLDAFSL